MIDSVESFPLTDQTRKKGLLKRVSSSYQKASSISFQQTNLTEGKFSLFLNETQTKSNIQEIEIKNNQDDLNQIESSLNEILQNQIPNCIKQSQNLVSKMNSIAEFFNDPKSRSLSQDFLNYKINLSQYQNYFLEESSNIKFNLDNYLQKVTDINEHIVKQSILFSQRSNSIKNRLSLLQSKLDNRLLFSKPIDYQEDTSKPKDPRIIAIYSEISDFQNHELPRYFNQIDGNSSIHFTKTKREIDQAIKNASRSILSAKSHSDSTFNYAKGFSDRIDQLNSKFSSSIHELDSLSEKSALAFTHLEDFLKSKGFSLSPINYNSKSLSRDSKSAYQFNTLSTDELSCYLREINELEEDWRKFQNANEKAGSIVDDNLNEIFQILKGRINLLNRLESAEKRATWIQNRISVIQDDFEDRDQLRVNASDLSQLLSQIEYHISDLENRLSNIDNITVSLPQIPSNIKLISPLIPPSDDVQTTSRSVRFLSINEDLSYEPKTQNSRTSSPEYNATSNFVPPRTHHRHVNDLFENISSKSQDEDYIRVRHHSVLESTLNEDNSNQPSEGNQEEKTSRRVIQPLLVNVDDIDIGKDWTTEIKSHSSNYNHWDSSNVPLKSFDLQSASLQSHQKQTHTSTMQTATPQSTFETIKLPGVPTRALSRATRIFDEDSYSSEDDSTSQHQNVTNHRHKNSPSDQINNDKDDTTKKEIPPYPFIYPFFPYMPQYGFPYPNFPPQNSQPKEENLSVKKRIIKKRKLNDKKDDENKTRMQCLRIESSGPIVVDPDTDQEKSFISSIPSKSTVHHHRHHNSSESEPSSQILDKNIILEHEESSKINSTKTLYNSSNPKIDMGTDTHLEFVAPPLGQNINSVQPFEPDPSIVMSSQQDNLLQTNSMKPIKLGHDETATIVNAGNSRYLVFRPRDYQNSHRKNFGELNIEEGNPELSNPIPDPIPLPDPVTVSKPVQINQNEVDEVPKRKTKLTPEMIQNGYIEHHHIRKIEKPHHHSKSNQQTINPMMNPMINPMMNPMMNPIVSSMYGIPPPLLVDARLLSLQMQNNGNATNNNNNNNGNNYNNAGSENNTNQNGGMVGISNGLLHPSTNGNSTIVYRHRISPKEAEQGHVKIVPVHRNPDLL